MGLYVKAKELRVHLNLDCNDEDEYLESLSSVAQASVERRIQCPLEDDEDKEGKLNPMLIHAIKIMVATLYDNRESVSFGQPRPVPYTLDYLIVPFIKFN